jgi:hypothetical protein
MRPAHIRRWWFNFFVHFIPVICSREKNNKYRYRQAKLIQLQAQ